MSTSLFTIYVDISCVSPNGNFSGISKTTYEIAQSMLKLRTNVKLVNIRKDGVHTCNRTEEKILGLTENSLGEDCIPVLNFGDVLFLCAGSYNLNGSNMYTFNENGLCIIPILYDLIPISHPQFVSSSWNGPFNNWIINLITLKNGIICISKSVADNFFERFNFKYPVEYFHLGCEKDIPVVETVLPKGKNVLMVSTIEPRKMYGKTLDQFERIWQTRSDINLIIVGNKGWLVDELIQKIETHPLRDKNLFHMNGLSEAELAGVYKNCDLFLFASEIEGFGLGVIEAARFGTPLLLRDTPVFREIAGDYATYFDDFEKLPQMITDGFDSGFKRSDGMPFYSWEESGRNCIALISKIRDAHVNRIMQNTN